MSAIDPITGQPLPANAIQRVLFIGSQVHVYQIPPLTSTKGYTAATWTEDPKRHIFTARLRVLETGTDNGDDDDDSSASTDKVKVDVILEDPASGQLFAAAPYNDAGVIESALDSSRFFAVRVQDGQGRRAMIGIGFEERPDAFDFGVALQEARKTVGLEAAGSSGPGAAAQAKANKKEEEEKAAAEKRDYSLKEGETITINLGGSSKFGRRSENSSPTPSSSGGLGGFSLAPPPAASSFSSSASSKPAGSGFSLPPPPPPNRRTANRRSVGDPSLLSQQVQQQLRQDDQKKKSAAELGFDDGQFGEFA
ncbi:adaptin ear-binding coat-associated protein 2 [Ophiostoma piceae UAMH 11346]|uniref:Adaptin ear-binding coat-associated protein 2 n=1 Tax=Ophiostoma piceae (strain UAMH 11346) TaxID=1262450 RepID=S3CTF6_OPHP1|nr:adaptin ear-binding coat-associated protein 2 [Ophiostoma piceae UAMH 11346]